MFKSAWWSVRLPDDWSGHQEERCATLRKTPPLGVLQVSAARKTEGPVTDDELRDFAADQVASGEQLRNVKYNSFSGFSSVYLKNQLFWREWWLRSGCLMIYITYNVVQGRENIEAADLEKILTSLEPLV